MRLGAKEPVKFAAISASSTNNTLKAAVTGKRIRVRSLYLIGTAALSAKFQSSTTSDLSGAMPLGANGGIVLPDNPEGWFQTVAGELLNLNLSASSAFGGFTYQEI